MIAYKTKVKRRLVEVMVSETPKDFDSQIKFGVEGSIDGQPRGSPLLLKDPIKYVRNEQ